MNEILLQKALQVIQVLESHQYQAYLVGGAVRDHLLGREVADADIATSALPDEVMQLFDKVFPTGIEHGTVLVRWEGESFEVTTFRQESDYEDFRHPNQVMFVTDIKEDLSRRDFTINAMAMDHNLSIIDPFHGRNDIHRQMLRTVGNATERFQEDPLRMMRAVRFSSQLGFIIERETINAIERNGSLLSHIAMERIAVEWEKLLAGSFIELSLEALFLTKLYKYIPIISGSSIIQEKIQHIHVPIHSISAFISYLTISEPAVSVEEWTKSWKLSNQTKRHANQIKDAIQIYRNGEADWAIYQVPSDLIEHFVLVYQLLHEVRLKAETIHQIKRSLPIHNTQQLAVNGNHIKQLFPSETPGKWIQELLTIVEKSVVTGKLKNDRNTISEWVINERDETRPTN
ncbi:CCA tRNA nucleotidyltransferase [Gracilibacillus oryzae]|uniref:CCA-adding enzyme n=1 Tax=Gracilibacillus oryzae TaxID=1672701 RepID=A0A7C8KTY5_9BACI|nr:CCA tRNA nucleotidyltransferase [Gracilibacillus oryzae]KAB8138463.1 CCA tRNA nucleotidyltransferase [Gracilibacillus oryzae]